MTLSVYIELSGKIAITIKTFGQGVGKQIPGLLMFTVFSKVEVCFEKEGMLKYVYFKTERSSPWQLFLWDIGFC